ncbi:golgi transport complex subunit Cog4 [Pseudovirgaria hyperparasitica]|uniref:Conserved oligomeric Golgi complex subunit 4 n=1 Tax=Pseudovirgaria hyperparasitica TaxID=470096 RepID=A0A6A6VW04_9PEZI|nr:golgi transport complex subunit Cog4 [Pseudovirgaria hyperparasitica]KAF2753820.1 golgi transport complex subunit Cog4 [Pseudovirgaria hyperparasitica]
MSSPTTALHETPNIYAAGSLAEIQASLAELGRQESSVTARLDALLASQKDLSRELGRLDLLRARLGSQVINTRAISNGMLSDAASTANRISSAVKQLDLEQSNVKATLEVVEQVVELKACVLGVNGSMGAPQDWETAAGYLSRASKIPADVIDGTFAEENVPTAEVPDPPRVTLDSAAESLCGLFLREFEKAAKDGDGSKVTRFFKLFPLIGRSDVGLDAYGRYVCHGVASRARTTLNSGNAKKEGFFYGNALTKLFEHIAQIVDSHEPLVERHYGTGMMVKVIERLQIEADVQGGIILDTWHDERVIDRKLTDIKSYAFSFLVQSFLPNSKPTTGTPRSSSPAVNGSTASQATEDEGVDMKEIDGLLGETALMLGRWSLYSRFIASKCTPQDDNLDRPSLVMPQVLLGSNLHDKVNKYVLEPFNLMTTFFFRRSVEKAFQLDESPSDLTLNPNKPLAANPPFITSAVDDVMYIVNQVLQRSLATSQRTVVASVIPDIGRVLGAEFVGMVQRKMRDESYPKAAIQGALPPEDKIISFLVLINNLDVSNDYIKRIVESHLPDPDENSDEGHPLENIFPFGHDAVFVGNILRSMRQSFESKSGELIHDSISVMFHQVMKPRIRTILTEAFRDIDYNMTTEEIEAEEGSDDHESLVKSRFDRGWNSLTRPIKRILTERNFDRLLTAAMPALNKSLESRIKSFYGRVNELGAVRMERDIANIVSVAVTGNRYGLRDAFARSIQMTLIMNMEDDEWEEVAEEDGGKEKEMGITWVLDKSERLRARAIVKDNA